MGDVPDDLIRRIWGRDASVWPRGEDDPAARLGWLDLPERMGDEVPLLKSFAAEVVDEFSHVVLLGMGGSSLAPEVFARVLGPAPGHPSLTVLDSTHPDHIAAVEAGLELSRTLFLVSSKSGTTVESVSLFRHFRARARPAQFAVITDPGTPLEALAADDGLRASFTAPPDVGGRYSALSLFGLVPAALLGVDLDSLLGRAAEMARACRTEGASGDNPGYRLGEAIAGCAREGRDKLTFLASDALEPFADWVEQLLAESTGKAGRGIVPVVHEPPVDASAYAGDRAFVRLRLAGDDTHDAFADALAGRGHPVARVDVEDVGALGAEMFRWEFATAVASAAIGVNAFDQPDVEAAKRAARDALGAPVAGAWPRDDPDALFAGAAPPELACVLAFAPATEAHGGLVSEARARLVEGHGVATSAGFGPRYLHSTGQLHKGGPQGVRALVILDEPERDVGIPGAPHGFARLVTAQAAGDARALEDAGRRVGRTTWKVFERWAQR